MKTFRQFLEQVETQQKALELAAKKTAANTKSSAIAGMRHRKHVHGEIAQKSASEVQQRQQHTSDYLKSIG